MKEITKEQLIELYINQGFSTKEIAKILHVRRSTVSELLKSYSIIKSKELKRLQASEKRKKTCLERYGVEYISQLDSSENKRKRTNLEKYGVEYPTQNLIVKEKVKQTNLIKYGTEYSLQNKEVIEKTIQTNLQKFGKEWFVETENFKEQVINTCLEKYGVKYSIQSKQVKEIIKSTCQQKYGTDYYFQSDDFKEKSKKTNLEKYGTEYASQSEIIKQKIEQTNLERYGKNPAQLQETKEKIQQVCLEKYGVPFPCMRDECKEENGVTISKLNLSWKEDIESQGYNLVTEKHLENRSYDLCLEDSRILIEINPIVTHNITKYPFPKCPIDKNYHYQKSKLANKYGYHCIHIWDWDNKSKILNLLHKKNKIYARNTEIKEISIDVADKFNNLYHLQNTCKGQQICLGLYYNESLVSLMSFGIPRYNKSYMYELLRYTTHPDYMIIGGAERLFKYFINNFNPDNIITYCDYSKFSGQVYKKLGFKFLRHNKPSCHWIKGRKRITQAQLNRLGVDKLLNRNYGKGTNNEELMLQEGFVQVYDCGQLVFEWKK